MSPKQLKSVMKKLEFNQKMLALTLGVHESTISRYVDGTLIIPEKIEKHIKLLLALRNK